MSPQLLGWMDVADVLRGFLQRKLWLSSWAAPVQIMSPLLLILHVCALTADLQDAGHTLPTQMLKLMTLLEKEGPAYSDRLLVTLRGE
jgi:hypothetical protein